MEEVIKGQTCNKRTQTCFYLEIILDVYSALLHKIFVISKVLIAAAKA